MSAELTVVAVFVWLVLGGFAFGRFLDEGTMKPDQIGPVMAFCLLLASFAAGVSFSKAKLATTAEKSV